jgi:hypothetical protein
MTHSNLIGCLMAGSLLLGAAARSPAQSDIEERLRRDVTGLAQNYLGSLEVEGDEHWGDTRRVWTGEVKLVTQGINSRLERIYRERNDGFWKRGSARVDRVVRLHVGRPRDTSRPSEIWIPLELRCQMRGEGEVRRYALGAQLFRCSGRARFFVALSGGVRVRLLPGHQMRLQWQAEVSNVQFYGIVAEQVGHVGGIAAQAAGEAIVSAVRLLYPKLERDLENAVKQAISDSFRQDQELVNMAANLCRGGSSPGGTSSSAGEFRRWMVTNSTSDGRLLHVRVVRRESPGRDGSKTWHFELQPGQTKIFSGHGTRPGRAPTIVISYWHDRNRPEPRRTIPVDNQHYVFEGRRGEFRVRTVGPVPTRPTSSG